MLDFHDRLKERLLNPILLFLFTILSTMGTAISTMLCFIVLFLSQAFLGVLKLFSNKTLKIVASRNVIYLLIIIGGLFIVIIDSSRLDQSLYLSPVIFKWLIFVITIVFFLMYIQFGEYTLETPNSIDLIFNNASKSIIETWFSKRLRNKADTVWLKMIISLSVIIIIPFIGILCPGFYNIYTVLFYGLAFAIGFNAINVFEHSNSHYHFFRANNNLSKRDRFIFAVINFYCEYVLNFMYSRVPKWYEVQHVVIHHAEDNNAEDTQSTLKYDRASFFDFSRCACKFAISGLLSIDILIYLIKKGRKKALVDLIIGLTIFYATLTMILFWNWQFVITVIAFRFGGHLIATLGFFQEHGMVDIKEPGNIYRNSLHFINDNGHSSLGDDAHVEHHLHQGRHWTKYFDDAKDNGDLYSNETVLGFLDGPSGLSNYYRYLWRGDFSALANYFVVYGQPSVSKNEISKLLQERTRPLIPRNRSKVSSTLDKFFGHVGSFLLPWWQENKISTFNKVG